MPSIATEASRYGAVMAGAGVKKDLRKAVARALLTARMLPKLLPQLVAFITPGVRPYLVPTLSLAGQSSRFRGPTVSLTQTMRKPGRPIF